MANAKIEIKIAELCFSGEGDAEWLTAQLDKILEKAVELTSLARKMSVSPQDSSAHHKPADLSGRSDIASQPLAVWLKSKNAESVQNTKFLATAIWLEAKGSKRLQTKDISSALSNASQRKLNNSSECLNQNVKKGFCEKEGSQFYVTEEGKRSLGVN